jgi:prepilin-type N-terminal cleavage/methylation domain-containing protein
MMHLSRTRFEGRRLAAFSLIEVMCAILILGIGLLGLTQGMTGALGSSKEAEMLTIAAQVAAGQIETLRAEGFLLEGDTEGDGGPGLTLYEWRQSITKSTVEGLYDVSVAVHHAGNGRQIYELHTLMFDPPVTSSAPTNTVRQGRGGGA